VDPAAFGNASANSSGTLGRKLAHVISPDITQDPAPAFFDHLPLHGCGPPAVLDFRQYLHVQRIHVQQALSAYRSSLRARWPRQLLVWQLHLHPTTSSCTGRSEPFGRIGWAHVTTWWGWTNNMKQHGLQVRPSSASAESGHWRPHRLAGIQLWQHHRQRRFCGLSSQPGVLPDKPTGSLWGQLFSANETDTDKIWYNQNSDMEGGQFGSSVWIGASTIRAVASHEIPCLPCLWPNNDYCCSRYTRYNGFVQLDLEHFRWMLTNK
jgi:hypothetical protein